MKQLNFYILTMNNPKITKIKKILKIIKDLGINLIKMVQTFHYEKL
jgi:hypothetical protein